MNKRKIWIWGFMLVIAGIGLALLSLPFCSMYDRNERFLWNIARNFIAGEIIFREAIIEIVPDRDEHLYKEFTDYRANHPEFQNLSENELIENYYHEHYKGKMYKMELIVKLTKKKVVTHKSKIAIPYKYVFILSVISIFTGTGIVFVSRKRSRKEKPEG